jgi:hypothetical protein
MSTDARWTIDRHTNMDEHNGYAVWWTVTDGVKHFDCDEESDAVWLAQHLNTTAP